MGVSKKGDKDRQLYYHNPVAAQKDMDELLEKAKHLKHTLENRDWEEYRKELIKRLEDGTL